MPQGSRQQPAGQSQGPLRTIKVLTTTASWPNGRSPENSPYRRSPSWVSHRSDSSRPSARNREQPSAANPANCQCSSLPDSPVRPASATDLPNHSRRAESRRTPLQRKAARRRTSTLTDGLPCVGGERVSPWNDRPQGMGRLDQKLASRYVLIDSPPCLSTAPCLPVINAPRMGGRASVDDSILFRLDYLVWIESKSKKRNQGIP